MVTNGGNNLAGINPRSPWLQQPAQFLHSAASAATKANPYILQPFYSMPLPAAKPSASSTIPALTAEPVQDTFSPSAAPPSGPTPNHESEPGDIAPKPSLAPNQPLTFPASPNTPSLPKPESPSSPLAQPNPVGADNSLLNATGQDLSTVIPSPASSVPGLPGNNPVGSPAALNAPNQPNSPAAIKAEQTANQVTEAIRPVLKSLFEEFEPARQEAEELIQNFDSGEISREIRPKVELLQAKVNEGLHKFPHPVRKTAERLFVHAFEDPKRQQGMQKLVNWGEQPPTPTAKAELERAKAKHNAELLDEGYESDSKSSLIDKAGDRLGHPWEKVKDKWNNRSSSHSSSSSLGKRYHKPVTDEDDSDSGYDEPIPKRSRPSSSIDTPGVHSHRPRPIPLDDDEF